MISGNIGISIMDRAQLMLKLTLGVQSYFGSVGLRDIVRPVDFIPLKPFVLHDLL